MPRSLIGLPSPALVTVVDQLSEDEDAIFRRLLTKIRRSNKKDNQLDSYYEGVQRLKHLGLAVPAQLRQFETVINIPRMAVDEVQRRMDVRFMIMPGEEKDSPELRAIYDDNNLESSLPMLFSDMLIFGRAYATVSAHETTGEPVVAIEHAPDMAVLRDVRTHEVSAALRLYRDDSQSIQAATLYLPGVTILLDRSNRWVVSRRLPHSLGVPVVAFINRQRPGVKHSDGTSEMADVIGLTDSIARTITNMQVANETHAMPQKYVTGIDDKDFIDPKTGNLVPVWEAYFTSVWTLTNKDAKPGSFTAASMDNFTKTVDSMMAWCAAVLGLPTRFMGQQTVNPASEGAIKADEVRLIRNVERKESACGPDVGILMGQALSVAKGEPVNGNRIKTVWFDPATPTVAERADALQKLAGGKAIISREGAWDELGWSESRKEREREYFKAELIDDTIEYLGRDIEGL